METLQIKKDAAIAAHENAKGSGKKLLEDLLGKKTFLKEVKDRIKTLEDVLEELGEKDKDVIEYRKLLSANVSEHLIGFQEAVMIVKVLNEGWVPDWSNSEWKYEPRFYTGSSGFRCNVYDYWAAGSHVGSHLCFKNAELAKYAGNQFTGSYKKFMCK